MVGGLKCAPTSAHEQRIVFLDTGIFKATGLPLAMAAREIRVENGIPTLVVSWDDLEDERVEAFLTTPPGSNG